MALITAGTNATTTLNGLIWNPEQARSQPTDIGTIIRSIKSQPSAGTFQMIAAGAFDQTGRLHFPGRRGFVNIKPGDFIGFDAVGWPVIISGFSLGNSGGWAHS